MSARKIDSVPSAKISFGPFSSSSACRVRCAGPYPSWPSERCQQKYASLSVIRRSGRPSPERSMNLRLGLRQSTFGSDRNGVKASQSRAGDASTFAALRFVL
jgi:hypothetical protein